MAFETTLSPSGNALFYLSNIRQYNYEYKLCGNKKLKKNTKV